MSQSIVAGGVSRVDPVIDHKVRLLCSRPYPGHKKGCPNYNDRNSCPPQARLLHQAIDLEQAVYCVWNVFAFGEHVARMRKKHSEWSQRQCECCLYWQGTARKHLRKRISNFLTSQPGRLVVIRCPEAMGVNVTATMQSLGLELEWPPRTVAYQVALVGSLVGRAD